MTQHQTHPADGATGREQLLDRRNGNAAVTRGYALRTAVQELTRLNLGAGPAQAAAQRAQAWAAIAALVDEDGYILPGHGPDLPLPH